MIWLLTSYIILCTVIAITYGYTAFRKLEDKYDVTELTAYDYAVCIVKAIGVALIPVANMAIFICIICTNLKDLMDMLDS